MKPSRAAKTPREDSAASAGAPSLSAAIDDHLALRGRNATLEEQMPLAGYMRVEPDPPAPEGGPPRFLYAEVVRVSARGDGTDDDGRPIDTESLLDRLGIVQGASATPDGSGWLIHLSVDGKEGVLELPEATLASTGLIEVVNERGAREQIALDRTRHRGWRDDVMLELVTDTSSEDDARALAGRVAAALRDLGLEPQPDWRLGGPELPTSIVLWIYPDGDAYGFFERFVASVAGWHHDEDGESSFISARWEPPRAGASLLTAGILSAELTYRCWTSPRQRGRPRRVPE